MEEEKGNKEHIKRCVRYFKRLVATYHQEAVEDGKDMFSVEIMNDPTFVFILSCIVKYEEKHYRPSGIKFQIRVFFRETMIDEWKKIFNEGYHIRTIFDPSIFIWLKLLEGRDDPFKNNICYTGWEMCIENDHLKTTVRFIQQDSLTVMQEVRFMTFPRATIKSRIAAVDEYILDMLKVE